jgi:sec-independent protein translocase protein TatC
MMSDKGSMLTQLAMVRNILLRAILVLIVIFIGLTFFQDLIYLKISEPLTQYLPKDSSMISTGVASPFLTPLKLTFYSAIFFALPYLAIEFWNFVSPGLYKKRKNTFYKFNGHKYFFILCWDDFCFLCCFSADL